MTGLAVGWAAVELAVPDGSPMGGYAARPGPSTGVLDPLQVAAVSIRAGTDRFVWLVADLPCVNVDLTAAIRDAVPGTVWLSATHTHAGPETGCTPGGTRTPPHWLAAVTAAATDAAARAVAAEAPATVELRRLTLRGVAGQRSGARPRRTVPVDVLSVHAPGGEVTGVITVLPVHPTVLDAANRCVSADLAGAVRDGVRERTGAWSVAATGAAGDVSTRPHRREQTPAECTRLGRVAAAAVVRSLRGPAAVTAGAPLRSRTAAVALDPKPATAVPIAALTTALAAAERAGDPVAIRTAATALQAAELARSEPRPADLNCAVAAVRLGSLTLLGLGAEPYLALRDELDGGAVLVGYTNGYVGYLPTRAAYGRPDYEVLRTPTAAGSAERALAAAVDLLEPTDPIDPNERPA
ncbi:hypothetical protein [Pseudonocardia sp. GCM10023141]|uniref:hypothetical protein n=1 Tax=Pseudonocardia sp. GCM10023141 TaxID=3252653 RepID=UPI0036206287